MKLGELIKLYRKWKDVTLRDLGAEIGVSAATLMRIEMGRSTDADTLMKVLNWLLARS